MATYLDTAFATTGLSTDAAFRQSITQFRAMLSGLGLVQTADTGQIDPVTVSKPGVISTVAGYEVWRFNDALQGTLPIYVKIEYGTSSAGTTVLGLWLTVGTATDGAGTVNGQAGTRTTMHSNTTNLTRLQASLIDSTLTVGLMAALSTTFNGCLGVIERPKDQNGGLVTEGIFTLFWGKTVSSASAQFIPSSGSVPSQKTGAPAPPVVPVWTQAGNNDTINGILRGRAGDLPVVPFTVFTGRCRYSSVVCLDAGSSGTSALLDQFLTFTWLGKARKYFVRNPGGTGSGWIGSGVACPSNLVCLIPWE